MIEDFNQMILRTNYEGDPEPTEISSSPTQEEVATAVDSMDWNRFASVMLFADEANWLDGSGCLKPGYGLSMMLSSEGIQYVTETAPPSPQSMLPLFSAYLDGNSDRLFSLIYDASERGLGVKEIARMRSEEADIQRRRNVGAAIAEAAALFSQKDYQAYIDKIGPFESLLGGIDAKKLGIARKKVEASDTWPGK